MHAMFRLPLLPAVALLVGCAPFAQAQSPQPDPVAPAVIGRPLNQLGPAASKRVPTKTAAVKPVGAKAAAAKPAGTKPTAPTVAAATVPAATAAPAPSVAPAQVAAAQATATQRAAKQALDDRADERMQLNDVGKGAHLARKPLGEGAYFADRHRSAARKYYEEHPVMRPAVKWKVGEPVPRDAVVAIVPRGLLAALPQVPPGHQYVELGGEVVLIAAGSKIVVDGISRSRPETALVSR